MFTLAKVFIQKSEVFFSHMAEDNESRYLRATYCFDGYCNESLNY
jgi:hypothetical protein